MQVPAANTYLPFGGGHRMCIGNRFAMVEMKTCIAHVVRRFTLALDPAKPVDVATSLTLGPRSGVHVVLQRRA